MDKRILFPLIVIILGVIIRLLIWCFTMSFLNSYRKYAGDYKPSCGISRDLLCILYKSGKSIEDADTHCSIFNLGDTKTSDVTTSNIRFPITGFCKAIVWIGAILFIVLFFLRAFYDIVWGIRLSTGKLERFTKLDCRRGIVSFWYIILEAFCIMWMFPLFLFDYDKNCVRSLYDIDNRNDDNQNATGYTVSLVLFSLLVLPLAFFGYRKFISEDKWMKITLGCCWLFNFVFVTVSIHRSFTAVITIYQVFAVFIVILWLVYVAEILMFWLKYYDNSPLGAISTVGGQTHSPQKDADHSAKSAENPTPVPESQA